MKTATVALRSLLGLIFLLSGLNGFVHVFPNPAMLEAVAFYSALANSRYMVPLICLTEVAGGVMLLSGFWVPLGLTILAPVIVNIFFFHLFLAPQGLLLATALGAVELFLAWEYRAAFEPLLTTPDLPDAHHAAAPTTARTA